MKHIILILSLGYLSVLLSGAAVYDPKSTLDEQLNALKQECREQIRPARYEGSRITYFTLRKKKQHKELELSLPAETGYLFAINGKACSAKLKVRFYDSGNKKTRKLLFEQKEMAGKIGIFNASELESKNKKHTTRNTPLKNIFIEYEIYPGTEKLEGIVLVIGQEH